MQVAVNILWTYVSALILKRAYLPTRKVSNFCFSFTIDHQYGCVSEVTP